jgi:hypothetical protein
MYIQNMKVIYFSEMLVLTYNAEYNNVNLYSYENHNAHTVT